MTGQADFDLRDFTPYLLAMAAETASQGFETFYKSRYGMLRTEWRVLFHLGRYGPMTATDIGTRARTHKTKISRAVAALEAKRFLERTRKADDRRREELRLTRSGVAAFDVLCVEAGRFDAEMMSDFSPAERAILRKCLIRIAGF